MVSDDGSIVVPADEVAELGFQPGQRVSATLSTVDRKPSRGLLKGHFPSLTQAEMRDARRLMLDDLEVSSGP